MMDFIIEDGILMEYNGTGGEVMIPDGVESIDNGVFYFCNTLQSLVISDSVESIEYNAFANCSNLRSIVFGKGLRRIGEHAFSDCPNVERIVVSEGNSVYHSVDNCLIDTKNKVLVLGCQNSIVPSDGSVKRIGESAFEACANLRNLIIPDCITDIDDWAFDGCKALQSIEIPFSVTRIAEYVFYNCASLQNVLIPDSVKSIGKSAFFNCTNLHSIVIPAGVTEIERHAFQMCTNLKSLVVEAGNPVYHSAGNCLIKTEEKTMVFGCASSMIPDDGSVTRIDDHVFLDCLHLRSIVIPSAVKHIGAWTFENCENLESVTISDGVETIGEGAFADCKNIKKWVLLPASQDEAQCKLFFTVIGKVKLALPFLKGNLETNDIIKKLLTKSITAKNFRADYIPDLIETQETEAFARLLSLIKKMDLEEIDGYMNLSVEKGAVEITSRLMAYKQKLYPPEKIAEMQEDELEKAIGVREKTLADYRKDFKIIKDGDFYVITGYKSEEPTVIIPDQIKGIPVQIGIEAFKNCKHILSVYIDGSKTKIGRRAFDGCENLTVYAPKGSAAQKYAIKNNVKYQTI